MGPRFADGDRNRDSGGGGGPLDVARVLAQAYPSCLGRGAGRLVQPPGDRGHGMCIGLIEAALDDGVDDLRGAELRVRCFAANPGRAEALREHGTHSVTLLLGQGHLRLWGLAPRASLYAATVAEDDGLAAGDRVGDAIDWLLAAGCSILAIPMGSGVPHAGIARALGRAAAHGVPVLAAAGNSHPLQLAFPARYGGVIAVGACDRWGRLRPECCRRPRLDIVAPGSSIPALIDRRTIAPRSGSSVACVVAAGLRALTFPQPGASGPHAGVPASLLDVRSSVSVV